MKKIALPQIVILLLVLAFSTFTNAQTAVNVYFTNGETQSYTVAESGKLYFSTDDLLIKTTASATVSSIPMSEIQKIIFSTENLSVADVSTQNNSKLSIYPNPVTEILYLKSNQEISGTIAIYDFQGRLVKKSENTNQINVMDLVPGAYILKTEVESVKFIKK